MGTILLKSVHYSKANEEFHNPVQFLHRPISEFERASELLFDGISRRLRAQTAHLDLSLFSACVACSTGLSPNYSEFNEYNRLFRRRIYEKSGIEPTMYITSYECANWGYLLRYLQRQPDTQNILMLILDVNLPYFEASIYNAAWERSGFGLTILNLTLNPGPEDHLLLGHTKTENGYFEFLRGIKSFADKFPDLRLSMPFFPAAQRRLLAQSFGARALPDRHDEYGHCFGSDPWIGLIRHLKADPSARRSDLITASFALGGYYCAARVSLWEDIRVSSDESLLMSSSHLDTAMS